MLVSPIVTKREIAVPMRDGARLFANLFRPAADGQYAVIMSVTPYGKDKQLPASRSPHLSNTSNVDVADAYNLPLASLSFPSAKAALRPNESTRPSARRSPVSLVIGL